MDLPDEELKMPLVGGEQQLPQTQAPPRDPSPKRPHALLGPATNNYVAMRNPPNAHEDEEKDERVRKQPLPYAAPNVHPYAVPQYQPRGYGGDEHSNAHGGWATSSEPPFDDGRGSSIDIAVSGMYTLAAALTVIQGFGMLVVFTWAASKCGRFGCGGLLGEVGSCSLLTLLGLVLLYVDSCARVVHDGVWCVANESRGGGQVRVSERERMCSQCGWMWVPVVDAHRRGGDPV